MRAGFVVALDTLVIRPRGYAGMLPADERAAFRRLGPGRAGMHFEYHGDGPVAADEPF